MNQNDNRKLKQVNCCVVLLGVKIFCPYWLSGLLIFGNSNLFVKKAVRFQTDR